MFIVDGRRFEDDTQNNGVRQRCARTPVRSFVDASRNADVVDAYGYSGDRWAGRPAEVYQGLPRRQQ